MSLSADRLEDVRGRIIRAADRAGRDPAGIRLVAVTKGMPAAVVAEALAAGHTDLGENRVQEAREKRALAPAAHWHLIGHLQTNKAAEAARLFEVVHSLDSSRIAAALSGHRTAATGPMAGLIEVDFSAIAGRTGVPGTGAEALIRSCAGLPGVRLIGLMTIAPPGDAAVARACFRELRGLRDRLRDVLGLPLAELSMGMSNDYEVAIEEGATIVRVGRAIFGDRSPRPRGESDPA